MTIASKFQQLKDIAMKSSVEAQAQINAEFDKIKELADLFNKSPSYDNFRMLEIQVNQSREKILKLTEMKL